MKFYKFSELIWTQSEYGMVYEDVGEWSTYYIPVENVKAIEVFHGSCSGEGGKPFICELYRIYTYIEGRSSQMTTDRIEIVDKEEFSWLKRT